MPWAWSRNRNRRRKGSWMARLVVGAQERQIEELPPAAVLGSMGIHVLIFGFMIWGGARIALPEPTQVYRVDLVAAPQSAPVREVPAPQTPRVRPEVKREIRSVPTRPVAVEEPRPEERRAEEKTPAEEPEPAEAEPEREAAASAAEAEADAVERPVRLEGAPFPYPEYLENIIIQIRRHWRPPRGARHLRAELAFTIRADGSVEDVRWIRRSGDPGFDLEARGAIESAARRRAFGPLPEEYPGDQLRVSFFFDPSRY